MKTFALEKNTKIENKKVDFSKSCVKIVALEKIKKCLHSIGNLSEEDYLWIKNTYAKETAQIMEAMELQEEEEKELISSLEREIKKAKLESTNRENLADKS